eukprot:Awhi_evm1s2305
MAQPSSKDKISQGSKPINSYDVSSTGKEQYLEGRIQKLELALADKDSTNIERGNLGRKATSANTGGGLPTMNKEHPVWFAEKLHEPGVIGLTGFSMATVLLGFLKVGYWEVESNPLLAFWGFFVGGAMQVQAGIYEHKCGNPFSSWAFTLFGWNWMATGLSLLFPALDLVDSAGKKADAMKAVWMFCFVLCLFIVSFRVSKYHIPMLFFVLMIFFAEVIGFYVSDSEPWEIFGGVSAIISGYMALVLALAIVLHQYWGRVIIPWFPYELPDEVEHKTDRRSVSAAGFSHDSML